MIRVAGGGCAVALALALAPTLGCGASVAGEPPRLEDARTGKVVALEPGAAVLHVVFFATWCPPCLDELPRLASLKSRWGDGRYRLVLVAVQNRQSLPKLAAFLESHANLPGEVLYDFEGQAERAFQAGDVPTHLVLDAHGHEVARATALNRTIETAIESVLVGHGAVKEQRR